MTLKRALHAFVLVAAVLSRVETTGICGDVAIRSHWSDCGKFVECGGNVSVVFKCPDRSFFNPKTLVCDFAMYHTCNVEHITDPELYSSQNILEAAVGVLSTRTICNDQPLGTKIRHPDNCDQFYHCAPSGPVLFTCPSPTLFNNVINVCDWPENVDCVGGGGGDGGGGGIDGDGNCPANCIEDNRCPIECEFETGIKLPHPSRCDAFLRCHQGCACFKFCDTGLWWSTELQRCVDRYRSDCVEVERPECPECEPDERCPLDDDPDNPIRFPIPDRCDAYIQCVNGRGCVVECPAGLEFNPETEVCDIEGECVITTPNTTPPDPDTTTTPITTTTTTSDCPTCPPGVCKPDDRCPISCNECEPVLLPHPDDCGMFLKCSHGFACEMRCPDGLHWSIQQNRCEWAHCAGCDPTIPPSCDCGGCP
ncbi:multiple epidermal growth factor-like domains protein 11 [Wyeomyia smithii]|uniref:multiple epidermal growth factor-like domains protein 11 n=1 Tax=Wyeomyia smithii TaxID=174621 RepID=UPI002467F4A2|nr:multiple epidermal growth factor-like domains protein 11 [Wyeomyia smithii]